MKNFRLLSLTFLLFFVYSSASAQEESTILQLVRKKNQYFNMFLQNPIL
jgi:hypothetical protein